VWEPDGVTPRPTGVKTIALAVAALLALTLSACGDGDSSAQADDKPAAFSLDDLSGRVFATSQVDGHALVDETVVRVGFTAGQVSVDAGCNHMTGTAALEGDQLTVSNLAGTEIGCAQDRADQDAWISDFLTSGPTVSLDGDTLTLAAGDVSMALAEQAVDDTPTGDSDGAVTNNG
jgi:heat shock protein HslJ